MVKISPPQQESMYLSTSPGLCGYQFIICKKIFQAHPFLDRSSGVRNQNGGNTRDIKRVPNNQEHGSNGPLLYFLCGTHSLNIRPGFSIVLLPYMLYIPLVGRISV